MNKLNRSFIYILTVGLTGITAMAWILSELFAPAIAPEGWTLAVRAGITAAFPLAALALLGIILAIYKISGKTLKEGTESSSHRMIWSMSFMCVGGLAGIALLPFDTRIADLPPYTPIAIIWFLGLLGFLFGHLTMKK